jgi:V/A-type H+-transporting ATPase subunit D
MLLELQDERGAMREGYRFLDEKRLLLAAEMLEELRRYEEASVAFRESLRTAADMLKAAVGRHGLEGLQVYPAARMDDAEVRLTERTLLGVPLIEAVLGGGPGRPAAAVNPSPEAESCREMFADLLRQAAVLAALAGNLERLRAEYRRTDRRARALEDVLLPEVEQTIRELESRLEEVEQEEAIRLRWR